MIWKALDLLSEQQHSLKEVLAHRDFPAEFDHLRRIRKLCAFFCGFHYMLHCT